MRLVVGFASQLLSAYFSLIHPAVVESNVELVDLNLSHALDGRPKMVLETIGREAEERVNQAIVPDDCQQGLFVVESVGTDKLWGPHREYL